MVIKLNAKRLEISQYVTKSTKNVETCNTKVLVFPQSIWYNFACTKEERGNIMYSSTKIYGETTIQNETKEERSIKLQYYCTKNLKLGNNKKRYGVGVIKTQISEHEVNEEKHEINHICRQKKEVENLLNMLLKNKVTPIHLKYVLEDLEIS